MAFCSSSDLRSKLTEETIKTARTEPSFISTRSSLISAISRKRWSDGSFLAAANLDFFSWAINGLIDKIRFFLAAVHAAGINDQRQFRQFTRRQALLRHEDIGLGRRRLVLRLPDILMCLFLPDADSRTTQAGENIQ